MRGRSEGKCVWWGVRGGMGGRRGNGDDIVIEGRFWVEGFMGRGEGGEMRGGAWWRGVRGERGQAVSAFLSPHVACVCVCVCVWIPFCCYYDTVTFLLLSLFLFLSLSLSLSLSLFLSLFLSLSLFLYLNFKNVTLFNISLSHFFLTWHFLT